jgi:hypothetical protein
MSVFLGFTELPKIFCETSQKLLSVEAFARTAKHYSVQNLGLCTPSEQLLTALQGNKRQRVGMCGCDVYIRFLGP